jgi:hypothetical protein
LQSLYRSSAQCAQFKRAFTTAYSVLAYECAITEKLDARMRGMKNKCFAAKRQLPERLANL